MADIVSVLRHGGLLQRKGKSAEACISEICEKKKLNDVFVPWTEVSHPDFQGKKTEVGG